MNTEALSQTARHASDEAYNCAANCYVNAAAIGEGWDAMAAGFLAAGDCLSRRAPFLGTLIHARKAGYEGRERSMYSSCMYAALPLHGIEMDTEGYIVL